MSFREMFKIRRAAAVVSVLCLALAACGNDTASTDAEYIDDPEAYVEMPLEEVDYGYVEDDYVYEGPIDLDGDGISDFFPIEYCRDGWDYMHSPLRDELSDYEIISNIIPDSIEYTGDGTVYFSSATPDGGEMRFWGYDLEVSADSIRFNEKGRLISLDSIGRIYSLDPVCIENSDENNWFVRFGACDLTLNMHPGSLENMAYQRGGGVAIEDYTEEECNGFFYDLEPYFFGMGTANPYYGPDEYANPGYYVLSKLTMVYRPETEMAPFREIMLNPMNYGCYIEGDRYDSALEKQFDPDKQIYDFDLIAIPDIYEDYIELPMERFYIWDPMYYGYEISYRLDYSVGDLRDLSGEAVDKNSARIESGMTLDVTLCGITHDVPINIIDTVKDATTQHDLGPHCSPEAVGDLNILCIPISWSDERERATDAQYEEFCRELGRVSDMSGNITDYSGSLNNRFALSEYMDIASYGKYNVTTYMTDWYPCEQPFSEMKHETGEYLYWQIYEWLLSTYPNQDWSKFDLNNDYYFDSVILLNAGDMSGENGFDIISFGGAVYMSETYGSNEAFYPEYDVLPAFNSVVYCHKDQFNDSTLIHEFSHNLGLIDYYDVTYSGIDALGGYDMQDGDDGDWNAFSKYSVGWIDPVIVNGLASGESVEYEISPMSSSGDAIVIPAAGDDLDDPFGEYMLVDLFANVGTHIYDAPEFGIANVVGVRIYHVDARMEARDFIKQYIMNAEVCPIGTVHYGNDYKANGRFELELIQAGGTNTFTSLGSGRTRLNASDFFMAGSSFTTDRYSQFFDGGVFDSGADFGYKIDIVSITGTGEDAKATIRITRQ